MLDYWHDEYVALKMRMFRDVVYNQFRHLNGPPPESYGGFHSRIYSDQRQIRRPEKSAWSLYCSLLGEWNRSWAV
jgi:hypothetical protein